MDISKALRDIRQSTSLNQKEFAVRAGLTQTYVSLIENGKKIPSFEVVGKYQKLSKTPLGILFWKAITEKDIQKGKLKIYRELKPLIDNLINQIF